MFNTKSNHFSTFEIFLNNLTTQLKLPQDFQLTEKYVKIVTTIMTTQTENHRQVMSCLF
ncbi:hypothetical protein ATP_00216 [Candidatus Phytoplasma mali]|uniref:Uncharacterized protein n=1 Tax=Phytoplasma mali (strain AT) TaxID=482235 RepID=B3QZL6_PHYMT|nr:hypothetical protein ATP_00216 [Candidatus Phytoplasma mali]